MNVNRFSSLKKIIINNLYYYFSRQLENLGRKVLESGCFWRGLKKGSRKWMFLEGFEGRFSKVVVFRHFEERVTKNRIDITKNTQK